FALCACITMVGTFLSFLFQAEDGIRDRNVTGVQTCALPISVAFGFAFNHLTFATKRTSHADFLGNSFGIMTFWEVATSVEFAVRSEERRVGKECRSRWAKTTKLKNVKGQMVALLYNEDKYKT